MWQCDGNITIQLQYRVFVSPYLTDAGIVGPITWNHLRNRCGGARSLDIAPVEIAPFNIEDTENIDRGDIEVVDLTPAAPLEVYPLYPEVEVEAEEDCGCHTESTPIVPAFATPPMAVPVTPAAPIPAPIPIPLPAPAPDSALPHIEGAIHLHSQLQALVHHDKDLLMTLLVYFICKK